MNNNQLEDIQRKLETIYELVLLAIPESRMPKGLKRPVLDRPALRGAAGDMSEGELAVHRERVMLESLDYLAGLTVTQRSARRFAPFLCVCPQGFLLAAQEMGVDIPLYPVAYLSVLYNLLSQKAGFKHHPRQVAEDTLERLQRAGKVRVVPLKEISHKTVSDTPVVVREERWELVLRMRDGLDWGVREIREAVENGTEWWLDGGDPWSGPQSSGDGDGGGGWAVNPEPESAPPKKKPASGGWSVGGGVS